MSYEEIFAGDLVGDLAVGDIVGELIASGAYDEFSGASDLETLMIAAGAAAPAARPAAPLQQAAIARAATALAQRQKMAAAVKARQLAGFNPTTFQYNPPAYNKARKVPMGFDSVTAIAPGVTATITQRPQVPFRPARLLIPSDIAGAILVLDFKVGNKSQLAANGGLPGRQFQEDATDSLLLLDTATPALDVTWIVQNIGGAPIRFIGSASGPAVE